MDILPGALFCIIGFCIMMYVLLDGFDLGVGILFSLFSDRQDRNTMMSTILPLWDGNQTWLVLGGASLYGAFPLAFSLLLPALYLPIFIMVLALLFRGITLEFRLKAKKSQFFWEMLFSLSSIVVTFIQGMILGAVVKGFEMGTSGHVLNYDLITPFNLTCGVALLFGYALLGSTWIIAKATGDLQSRMFYVASVCLFVISIFLVIVSIWTPFLNSALWDIWFNPHYFYKLAILPFITGCLILYFAYSLYKRREYILFWLALGIFICSYAGVGISTFPYLIPRILTVQDAAAPTSSLWFMLIGIVVLLPFLMSYTLYSYYIFRGKVTEVIGYD